MKSVSIIIPNWNGRALLEKNIPFVLEAKSNKRNQISEIIVVDDGSTDDSVKFLKKTYNSKVRLIKHTKNRGFAVAVNTGVRMAKGDYVCLLNSDVAPSEDFLHKTLPHFKNPNVFGVSFHEKGYGYAVGKFEDGFVGHRSGEESKESHYSFWVNGGSSIFVRRIWMDLKGFDEVTFHPFYWEDIDIAYRAQKRGYLLMWEPGSMVDHKHETTINASNFRTRYMNIIKERNQLLFTWKNITSSRLTRKHLKGLIMRIVRHPGYIRILFHALRKIRPVLRARKLEAKETTVSDEAIFARFN